MYENEINQLRRYLEDLVKAQKFRFDANISANLPTQHGLYRISLIEDVNITIRAGRTKTAQNGLQQRIYQNHFQGDQNGNLRRQLVSCGDCNNLEETKDYIRNNLQVQFLVLEEPVMRARAEYFMLSVLCPKFWDD